MYTEEESKADCFRPQKMSTTLYMQMSELSSYNSFFASGSLFSLSLTDDVIENERQVEKVNWFKGLSPFSLPRSRSCVPLIHTYTQVDVWLMIHYSCCIMNPELSPRGLGFGTRRMNKFDRCDLDETHC